MTYFSALMMAGNPVSPSFSTVGVATTMIFALGAITWLYSTSSSDSPAHPARLDFGL